MRLGYRKPLLVHWIVMSCDHGYTLRLRGRQGLHFFRWRFDNCVFVAHEKKQTAATPDTFQERSGKTIVFVVGHLVLGLASGLEAFSREPPCDSFGALAVRQTPETRGTAWEFLSYYPILPSRYLRDPFTISRLIRFHTTHVVLDTATKYTMPYRAPKRTPFALRE